MSLMKDQTFNGWVPEFVWGCPHIGHPKLAFLRGYQQRLDDMDEKIVELCNAVVGKKTRLLLFGDVMLCHPERARAILERMNGEILLIRGNHDKPKNLKPIMDRFEGVLDYKTFKYQSKHGALPGMGEVHSFVCSHYPMASWDGMYHGSVMLHAHSHGGSPEIPNRYDISMDTSRIVNGARHYDMRSPLAMSDICKRVEEDRERIWDRLVRFEGGVYREYETAHQSYDKFLAYVHEMQKSDEELTGRKILSIHLLSPAHEEIAGIISDL